MYLPNEPTILLSFINTKLRDEYDSLSSLCEDFGVQEGEIVEKLALIGYTYSTEGNKFV